MPIKDEDPAAVKRRRMEEGQSVLEKAKGKGRRKYSRFCWANEIPERF